MTRREVTIGELADFEEKLELLQDLCETMGSMSTLVARTSIYETVSDLINETVDDLITLYINASMGKHEPIGEILPLPKSATSIGEEE